MRWTERQRAMLQVMGVRLWERAPLVADEEAVVAEVAVVEAVVAEIAVEEAVVTIAVSTSTPSENASKETALPAADWLFVGEPLDGGSSTGGAETQLLDNMLRAIGIGRQGAARAQRAAWLALAERPAGSAVSADAERREHLRRAVEIVRPLCIVALGRSAAQLVLASDEPLGSLRGRRHEHDGVAVFVTCPLAFLLRHPEEKAKAWADLCMAIAATDAMARSARPD